MIRLAAAAAAALAALAAWTAPAAAQAASAQCKIVEITASNQGQGIDTRLGWLKDKLSKPPFKSFDTFKFVAEHGTATERNKQALVPLANGRLALMFKDRVGARLRYDVERDDKAGKRVATTTVEFASGDMVIWAGEAYEKGTYVLVVSCTAK